MRAWLGVVLLCSGCIDIGQLKDTYCAAAGTTLCDGFENGLDPNLWAQSMTAGAMLGVTANNYYHNTHSLDVTADAGAAAKLEDKGKTASLAGTTDGGDTGDIFVRVRLSFTNPLRDYDGTTLVRLGDAAQGASLTIYDGGLALTDTAGNVAYTPFFVMGWTCIELDYVRNNFKGARAPATLSVFQDEDPSSDPTSIVDLATNEISMSSSMTLGVDRSSVATGPPGLEVFYDDVIVDGHHIGCIK